MHFPPLTARRPHPHHERRSSGTGQESTHGEYMVETQANDQPLTLATVLVRRARAASDGRLVLDAVGGLIAGAVALVLHPPGWPTIASAATCFLAFGVWGITDRTVRESGAGARGRALRTLRGAAVALGILGGVALAVTAMATMLGTWIS